MKSLGLLFPALIVAAVAVAAGCGGGGSLPKTPSPRTTPYAGATAVPVGPSPVTVSIGDGSGNGAQFTMPQVLAGGEANLTAAITNVLPGGVVAPSLRRAANAIGANVTSIEYLNVSLDQTVGISTAPTVTFTLSSAIASSQQTYLLFWDPEVAGQQGWSVLLGPGTVGSTRKSVTFNGGPTGQTFVAGDQYVYALAMTSQPVPTAKPAPTPTGLPSAMPTYCGGFATASPDPALGAKSKPIPLIIKDNSQLAGANVVLYATDTGQLQNGATPAPGTSPSAAVLYPRALNKQGQWVTPSPLPYQPKKSAPVDTPIQAFPLACFPGSIAGHTGRKFLIPVAASGLLYIALAPSPSPGVMPDPLHGVLVFNPASPAPYYGLQAPSLDWRAGLSGGFVTTPWDVIEYNLGPSPSMDTTQENKIGLPLEVRQGSVDLGFGPYAYQNVLNDLNAHKPFNVLPSYANFGGTTILARIIAPGTGAYYGFPQDYFYNNYNYRGGHYYAKSALNQGYIGYLLQQYKTHPQTFNINGAGAGSNGHVYCATSDGKNTFEFTDIGAGNPSSNICAASPAPSPAPGGLTYALPAWNTLEGSPTQASTGSYCQTSIFLMVPGSSSNFSPPLTDQNAYWLWKAMILDVARGMALQDVVHPYSGWNTGSGAAAPSPSVSGYWKDPIFDTWAWALHKEMILNKAYALQYDEPGGMSTAFTPDNTGTQKLMMTIQSIPQGLPKGAILTPTTGGAAPWPIPPALPCPTGP